MEVPLVKKFGNKQYALANERGVRRLDAERMKNQMKELGLHPRLYKNENGGYYVYVR